MFNVAPGKFKRTRVWLVPHSRGTAVTWVEQKSFFKGSGTSVVGRSPGAARSRGLRVPCEKQPLLPESVRLQGLDPLTAEHGFQVNVGKWRFHTRLSLTLLSALVFRWDWLGK